MFKWRRWLKLDDVEAVDREIHLAFHEDEILNGISYKPLLPEDEEYLACWEQRDARCMVDIGRG